MSGHFILLLGLAVGAGVITAISPCVYPVLPILFAGGSSRRPLRIIAGLVASFATFTLFATWILKQLGLPQDFLRNLAIGLLFLLAATLVFPQVGVWLARPLYFLSRRRLRLANDPRDRLLLARRGGADARGRLARRGRNPPNSCECAPGARRAR